MKKAVVTGATGYIGSHLANYLVDEGFLVSVIIRQESDLSALDKIKHRVNIFKYDNDIHNLCTFFKNNNPDVVFHVAAAVITNYSPEQIPNLVNSNILFGTQILEAMRYSNCRSFINTGSYWQNFNSETYNPLDLYAATKEAFEKIIQYYVDAHQVRCITLRLFDVYGEDDKRPKLLNLLCRTANESTSLDISPGEQYLELVHVSDVCSAYLKSYELMLENTSIRNNIYGIYSENKIQLKDLVHLVQTILGEEININIGAKEYREREAMNPCSTYESLPNWKPVISIEKGLKNKLCY